MEHKMRKKEMSELERIYQFGKNVNDAAEVSREYYEKTGNSMFKISIFFLTVGFITFGFGVVETLFKGQNSASSS